MSPDSDSGPVSIDVAENVAVALKLEPIRQKGTRPAERCSVLQWARNSVQHFVLILLPHQFVGDRLVGEISIRRTCRR